MEPKIIHKRLSDEQRELVSELVHNSIQKAVDSMTQMLKIRVTASHIDFSNGPIAHISEFDLLGRFKTHLVKMVFSGDISGAFFFVMLDHEVELINSVCLPQSLQSDKRAESKLMKHGFMSEIENIIASLSIKEISEYLGVTLELKVPQIQIISGNELNKYFEKQNSIYKTAFHVRAVLEGTAVNISPNFIWVLNTRFIDFLRLNTSEE